MIEFTIYGRLDGLNDYINACRTNPYSGARMKQENEDIVTAHILEQISEKKAKGSVSICFVWHEANKKRDPDNVCAFGKKVILDALVKNKVLENDTFDCVNGFVDIFKVDEKNPRIEVSIKEAGESVKKPKKPKMRQKQQNESISGE